MRELLAILEERILHILKLQGQEWKLWHIQQISHFVISNGSASFLILMFELSVKAEGQQCTKSNIQNRPHY